MQAARGGDSPGLGSGGRGRGEASGGLAASGRRRKKKPKGGKEGMPRERGNSDASSHKPTMILSKMAGETKSQDTDRTPGSERSSRQPRPTSPGPQIKIKVRDREDTLTQSQTPTAASSGSPATSTGTSSHSQGTPIPVAQGKHGADAETRGREGSSSERRLYSPGQRVSGGPIPGISIEVPIHKRLAAPPYMSQAVRLVDNSFQWVDNGTEYLLDQTDYLVIGILGLQGSGKSTLMSLLAGNQMADDQSDFIFEQQTPATMEQACHQTSGLDMFITEERVILLDTQPVLSSSILDRLLGPEKQSLPAEYSSPEHYAEMQSLHIAAFLLTVCHVVIVVEDWFSDINLVEFLKRAEMLKPATPPPPSSQSSETSVVEDQEDFVPNIVFVQNKANRESFQPVTVHAMERSIHSLMTTSKLKYTGCSSIARSAVMPCLNPKTLPLDVNLFLVPDFKSKKDNDQTDKDTKSVLMRKIQGPQYIGHAKPDRLVKAFRNQLYSASRPSLTNSTLNEKNWYQYASRTWEALKKSSLLSEYHRLLT